MVKTIEKFGAEWCGPCKVMDKILQEFSKKHPEVTVRFIDVDEQEELAKAKNIKSVPASFIYDEKGQEISRFVGIKTVADLESYL